MSLEVNDNNRDINNMLNNMLLSEAEKSILEITALIPDQYELLKVIATHLDKAYQNGFEQGFVEGFAKCQEKLVEILTKYVR